MTEIGSILKQKREEKGLSYKDVQDAIKIRAHYLAALEAGDFSVIPGEVYLKGFLTNYATFLGIDRQEILSMYHRSKKDSVLPDDYDSSTSEVQGYQNAKPQKYPYKLGIYIMLFFVLSLGIGLYLYYFLRTRPADRSHLEKDIISEEKEALYSEKVKPEDIVGEAPSPVIKRQPITENKVTPKLFNNTTSDVRTTDNTEENTVEAPDPLPETGVPSGDNPVENTAPIENIPEETVDESASHNEQTASENIL